MGHHGGRHQRHQEQQYGAYPGSNPGYQGSSYGPPPVPAYGYQQQPLGLGGYGVPPVQYGAVQSQGGYGYAQPEYGGAMQPSAQQAQMQHYRADEQRHRTNEHRAEAVALGAAAFAAYEHHEVKVDPEHATRHQRRNESPKSLRLVQVAMPCMSTSRSGTIISSSKREVTTLRMVTNVSKSITVNMRRNTIATDCPSR